MTYTKLFCKYPAKYTVKSWSYPIVDRHLVQFDSLAVGANAYLITRQAAQFFLETIRVISRLIDLQMDCLWSTGGPVFGSVPICAIELVVETTIKHQAVPQRNFIPRWRYLRGRAMEHAW